MSYRMTALWFWLYHTVLVPNGLHIQRVSVSNMIYCERLRSQVYLSVIIDSSLLKITTDIPLMTSLGLYFSFR